MLLLLCLNTAPCQQAVETVDETVGANLNCVTGTKQNQNQQQVTKT